ncbi:DUF4276 family protein [Actinomyces lilanjuaniae]|uniref:DUF4276 family protein n=1 Tax=Actinomyces lilanjuaniae TaxID=2321394 RepID=A0ABN5PML6_9ACTO|nr:DUF4276 family protein [Actinomyces lilanjuaniae]AYD89536.1 DUF4276 family protein [Actinomyces lilanjuaniae]
MTPCVGAVVEGHGEVSALPVLIRRIAEEHGHYGVRTTQPHRLPRAEMTGSKVAKAVRMQRLRAGQGGVVVLCDADDDDPQKVRRLTLEALGGIQTVVAVAVREYEAWFLAAAESLRSHTAVRDDASFDGDPERPRDAKGRLEQIMTESYKETLHQVRFTGVMSLEAARGRSPSFAAFEHDLLVALGGRDGSADRA